MRAAIALATFLCARFATGNISVRVRGAPLPARLVHSDAISAWAMGSTRITVRDVPSELTKTGMRAFIPGQHLGLDTETQISITCPPNDADLPCEVFASIYHCPPCSSEINGGLLASLVSTELAWTPGCKSPHFTQAGDDETVFPMLTFQRLVPAGTTEILPPLTQTLAHILFFGRSAAEDPSVCGGAKQASGVAAAGDGEQPAVRHAPAGPAVCQVCAKKPGEE